MSNILRLDHRGRAPLPDISIPDGLSSVVKTFRIELSALFVLEVEIRAEHDNTFLVSSRFKGPFRPMLLTVFHNDTTLCWYVPQASATHPEVSAEAYRACTCSGWLRSPPSWKGASIQISPIGTVLDVPVASEWQKKPNQLAWKHVLEGKDANVAVAFDGRSFLCDRMVLRAHSEVFRGVLDFHTAALPDSKAPQQACRIITLDAHPLVFLLVIKAMYLGCGEAWRLHDADNEARDRMWKEPRGFAVWADVMRLAERYDIPVVREGARNVLCASMGPATFNIAGGLLREIPDEKLFDAMSELMKTHTTATLASQLWGSAKDLDDVKARTPTVERERWLTSISLEMKTNHAGDKRKVPAVAAAASASASGLSCVPQTASQLYDSAERAWRNGTCPDTIIDGFCRYKPAADGRDVCVFEGDDGVSSSVSSLSSAAAPAVLKPAIEALPVAASDAALPPAPKKPKL